MNTSNIIILTLGLTSYVFGYDTIIINHNNKPIFTLDFYAQGESSSFGGESQTSSHNLTQAQRAEVLRAAQFWADILGANATNFNPIPLSVGTIKEKNASAISYDILHANNSSLFADILYHNLTLENAKENLSQIPIDKDSQGNPIFLSDHDLKYLGHINMGTLNWYIAPHPSTLPTNANQYDTFSTFTHELFHALGLASTTTREPNDAFATSLNAYTQNLVDSRGVNAQKEMLILDDNAYQSNKNIFLVDSEVNMWEGNIGGSLSNAAGHAYFVGNHVNEVIQNAELGFDAFNGLPISGWENGDADLSHIELDNSLMSHQTWINYLFFMEAELALLQDLGYVFDRKLFYGDSIYENGITWESRNGFYDRENNAWVEGSYNPSTYGVGLHIYGRENTATQNHNILSQGIAASGIRIDGSNNTLNIHSKIHTLGDYSNGVLVSYGKNHTINHKGEIKATGKEGIGIHLNFGDNEAGNSSEYRGSYMFANPDYDLSEWQDFLEAYRLDGALVSNLNLQNGSYTEGSLASIFIANNAFVENINIQNGATIKGDIISLWNPNNPHLLENYQNQYYTTLNFGNQSLLTLNDPISFDGGIYGYESIKLNNYSTLALGDNILVYDLYNNASLTLKNSNALIGIKNHFENSTNATLYAPINAQGKLNLQIGNSASLAGNLNFYMAKDFYKDKLTLNPHDLLSNENPINITGNFANINYDSSLNASHTLNFKFDNATNTLTITRNYEKFAKNDDSRSLALALKSLALNSGESSYVPQLFQELDFTQDTNLIANSLDNLNAKTYLDSAKISLDFQKSLNEDFINDFNHSSNHEWIVQVSTFGTYQNTKENGDFNAYKGYNGGIHTKLSKNFNDSWDLAFHFIFNSNNFDFENNSNSKSKGGYFGITSKYDFDSVYLLGSLRLGYEYTNLERALNIGAYSQNFSSSFHSLTTSALAGLGKDFTLTPKLSISPLVYGEINSLHTPDITESNEGAALEIKSDNHYFLGSFAGLKLAYNNDITSLYRLKLTLLGGYYHLFTDNLKVNAKFKNDSNHTPFYAQNTLDKKGSLRLRGDIGLFYKNGFFTNLALQSNTQKHHTDFFASLEAGIRF